MLDTETKRRIDTARDILVGKVPDPKSQVEQITIALIYKFMDDMDAESEDLGGSRSFFAGEFAKYGWTNLMAVGLQAQDTLRLYEEGIERIPQNPGIPELFRDIFKNAYLPYRDPATLKSFLKVIDEFTYDHSEKLGDAFEYLLSVLGSQGDAGQFRTPRHIIDFMVAIIDPKKDETILDPACGTAGFLISAYKHILKANQDEKGRSTLTPDEKANLAKNFLGYDISPDMVRLSLVNLYLHGFTDPHIYEYDTLTSEDRWNDTADVILANPPFMSPKGGIKPHNRFSIDAKRSEVLFVDYMAEHLTPNGRSAIIVPEGIIFQSQGAYRDLRKLLVENSLVAVISLPAGCFNPYSGVKTSILILDKTLASKSDTVAFFKVENDGFGLGSQRRVSEKDDLPFVGAELISYQNILRLGDDGLNLKLIHGHVVEKANVAANGEYNLSGERYRSAELKTNLFPLAKLSEISEINPKKSELKIAQNTPVSFVPMSDLNEFRIDFQSKEEKLLSDVTASYTYFKDNDLLLAKVTPCFENGKAGIARNLLNGIGFGSSEFYVLRSGTRVLPSYLYFCVTQNQFRTAAIAQMTGTGGLQRIPRDYVENFLIPVPPIDIQKEIVAEIEGYQRVIDGARAVIDNYRPHIPINPDWPQVELDSACNLITCGVAARPDYVNSGIPFLSSQNVKQGEIIWGNHKYISENDHFKLVKKNKPEMLDILYTRVGSYGEAAVIEVQREFSIFVSLTLIKPRHEILNSYFLKHLLNSSQYKKLAAENITGVGVGNLNVGAVRRFKIPLPPLSIQLSIVAEIESEQALVTTNRELITRFEKKIQDTLGRIWGSEDNARA